MKKPHNIDPDRNEGQPADSSESSEASTETGEELPGGYYYDDSTGYEIFTDDEDEEKSPQHLPDKVDQPS